MSSFALRWAFILRFFTQRLHMLCWLGMALAFVMFLSTTGVGIIAASLLTLMLLRGDFQKLRWHWHSPLVMPIMVLFLLFMVSMLWSNAPLEDVKDHWSKYLKLICLPALILALARGRCPEAALYAAFVGLTILLALSVAHFIWPGLSFWPDDAHVPGVPIRTYTLMNLGSVILAHGLLLFAWREAKFGCKKKAALAVVVALVALAHLLFVVPSRTGVVVLIASLGLLCVQIGGAKHIVVGIGAAVIMSILVYSGVPKVRERFDAIQSELATSLESGAATSSGIRWEMWRSGIKMVANAPIIGHGIGSLPQLYRSAAAESEHGQLLPTEDPHSQPLSMAIPFGAVGVVILLTVWGGQIYYFCQSGSISAFLGQAVVVQNIVAGLFNSSITAFDLGWFYVTLVGILAAAVWRDRRRITQSKHWR
ncbi:O-antigen ligase family protein [Tepidamorphus sp. 3E244]|uniref:O-antigen ligase family protein n=1 Tax=Tepidamorphus sp. 3E244 TaxID=3385498 RepID=UPI0038FD0EAE